MDTRGSGTPTIHVSNEGESLAVKDLKCQLNDSLNEIKGEFLNYHLTYIFLNESKRNVTLYVFVMNLITVGFFFS